VARMVWGVLCLTLSKQKMGISTLKEAFNKSHEEKSKGNTERGEWEDN